MEKLFTVAGTSNLNGTVKFRFANDLKGRLKVLAANGHTDIMLFELPQPMTKAEATAYLEAQDTDKPTLTVKQLKAELKADGELESTMTDQFLAEVVRREAA